MTEVAPGVHRIAFAIGAKPMAMYMIEGDDGLILIDTGLPGTPEAIYLPAIRELGHNASDVRLIVITHADADHIGGNATAKRLFPNAQFLCHERDLRWVSDPAILTSERYDGFSDFGLRYEQAVFDMLASWMGPPSPIDITVRGGERIRRAGDDWLTLYHVPGHTPGHLCLHNPAERYAIVGDALFGRSQLDTTGGWSAPPPYLSVEWYRTTLQLLESLDLDLLLTCHYPVMRGAEITEFIDASRDFIDRAAAVIDCLLREATAAVTLGEAIDFADPLLGPFGFARDLQFALLAHLDDAVGRGKASRTIRDGVIAWLPIPEE